LAVEPGAEGEGTLADRARRHIGEASALGQFFPKGYEKKMRERVRAELHDFVKAHVPEGIPVQHIVGEGTVYSTIIETARKIGADLVVMQAHRPELGDYLLGPNAACVVRHADCSVLVVR